MTVRVAITDYDHGPTRPLSLVGEYDADQLRQRAESYRTYAGWLDRLAHRVEDLEARAVADGWGDVVGFVKVEENRPTTALIRVDGTGGGSAEREGDDA